MPAVMMTNVTPIASVPMTTVENSKDVKFENVRKSGLAIVKIMKMTMSPPKARNC
jgi:hypothetical protein